MSAWKDHTHLNSFCLWCLLPRASFCTASKSDDFHDTSLHKSSSFVEDKWVLRGNELLLDNTVLYFRVEDCLYQSSALPLEFPVVHSSIQSWDNYWVPSLYDSGSKPMVLVLFVTMESSDGLPSLLNDIISIVANESNNYNESTLEFKRKLSCQLGNRENLCRRDRMWAKPWTMIESGPAES